MKQYKKFKRLCVLDTETTDKYWNSAAPVQIAALIVDNQGKVLDSFNERIKTTHTINPDASAVHGIYVKDLVHCRSEKDVLEDFCVWMTVNNVDACLTYNGEAFDRPMLNERCKHLHIPYNFFEKEGFPGIDGYYDCVFDAKKINLFGLKDFLGRKWRLSLVAECLGIDNTNAHDALADVTMLKEIFFMVDPIVHAENWEDITDERK